MRAKCSVLVILVRVYMNVGSDPESILGIAKRTGVNCRTVLRCLKTLRELGIAEAAVPDGGKREKWRRVSSSSGLW